VGASRADLRLKPLTVTREGQRVYAALLPIARERNAKMAAALNAVEREHIDASLAKLLAACEQFNADQTRKLKAERLLGKRKPGRPSRAPSPASRARHG
jgi:hypothetical protein